MRLSMRQATPGARTATHYDDTQKHLLPKEQQNSDRIEVAVVTVENSKITPAAL